MPLCPSCEIEAGDWESIASHMTGMGDSYHTMWLNRNISIYRMSPGELAASLEKFFKAEDGLGEWIRRKVVERIYSGPHPFISAMQRPSRAILLGYVYEHRHFLTNWVQVLSSVIYGTDDERVIGYELANIETEYVNGAGPSHFELLLRMGESLGANRQDVLASQPLSGTANAIRVWRDIAKERSWVETMAAMHSLEFIADRRVKDLGARIHYFNVDILESDLYTPEARKFLREGYEADTYHASEAMKLVEEHALGQMIQKVQLTVLKSLDAVSTYLNSRLERARMLEGSS
ncbi:MAG: iron-containing redox enzyme family protein [Nitrososphaerota archaeon]|nr:iron-containing redox enzyme family protein [Nitrososphaerota archaeon]